MCVEDSYSDRPTKVSWIIDIMDQTHCIVPRMGNQLEFPHPLKQMITGIKQHGKGGGITLYRTINTITKSADLIIYCVLAQLEKWKEAHEGRYPEEIYLQVDGGSENANQYVLAMLELLVVKRMARLVYFTRLPTGHTHEDIDATFAVVWKVFRKQHCETLELYKQMIEEALGSDALSASVVDIMVVPNYVAFLKNSIDSQLARLHHNTHTQHQWRFQAVVPSAHFPLGCKTLYRAYASKTVIEFVVKPKAQCISDIGQFTGLEPVLLTCPWFPAAHSDPNRPGVEGFYILRDVPHVENFQPRAFSPGVSEEIKKTLDEVRKRFDAVDCKGVIDAWTAWKNMWAPVNDSADDYVAALRVRGIVFHCPLKMVLKNKNLILTPEWMDHSTDTVSVMNQPEDFPSPEVLAYATNSVVSEFNPNAGDPRIYVASDVALADEINHFHDVCEPFYDSIRATTLDAIKAKLRCRIPMSGALPSTAGKLTYFFYFF